MPDYQRKQQRADPAALNRHQAGSVPPNRAGVANQINQPQGEEGNTMYQLTVRNQRIRSDDLEYIMRVSHILQKRGYTNIDTITIIPRVK